MPTRVLLVVGCLLHAAFGLLPATTIVRGYGYPCEEHIVQTSDGYLLTMMRIPHGKTSVANKGVVMLQHGLTDTSAGFCLNNPTEALPYILADSGYDVWLGNNRGNGYSMGNINYHVNSPQFWDFSWDEMALYDMPAQIEYVLQNSNRTTLSAYIGHSEGTIQAFAGFSVNHTVASLVDLYIALAPVAYVSHVEAVLMQTLAKFDTDIILELLGVKEFYLPNVIEKLLPDICKLDPTLCDFELNLLMGPSVNLNITRMPYYMRYEPNPTSVKNMAHWAQGVRTGTFQMFDYGTQGNQQHYNQPTPPPYKLSNLPSSLPVALFCGTNDFLADPQDVEILLSQLSTSPYVHTEATYAHVDFLWAEDANTHIYPQVLTLIQQHSKK